MTTIEWTDETWNPVTGCDQISPGCAHCYAKALHDMRYQAWLNGKKMPEQYHVPFEVVTCQPGRLEIPLHWRAPRMCFVNSMSDLFHQDVPEAFIDRVLAAISQSPAHTFQILTKRADRMLRYFDDELRPERIDEAGIAEFGWCHSNVDGRWPLPNLWPGVSVESKRYLSRLDDLRKIESAVRMVSFEPLLEDLGTVNLEGIGWAIVGGESGPKARPMHPDWVRSLRDQCIAAGVPLFFKQWGQWAPDERRGKLYPEMRCFDRQGEFLGVGAGKDGMLDPAWKEKGGACMVRVGKKHSGALLDGREWREFPKSYPGHQVVRLQRKAAA